MIGIVGRHVISAKAKHPVMQHGGVVAVIIVVAIGGGLVIDFDLGV